MITYVSIAIVYQKKQYSISWQRQQEYAQEWLRNFSVGKDDHVEFRQRFIELHDQRRHLWEVITRSDNQPFVQIAAPKEIHALTKSILQLYETLPMLLTNCGIDKN